MLSGGGGGAFGMAGMPPPPTSTAIGAGQEVSKNWLEGQRINREDMIA